jgi:hypothetical protein
MNALVNKKKQNQPKNNKHQNLGLLWTLFKYSSMFSRYVNVGINSCGRTNIQIVHYFGHGYIEEEKSMIHSFTVTIRAKYLTRSLVFLPTKLSVLLRIIFFISLNNLNVCSTHSYLFPRSQVKGRA